MKRKFLMTFATAALLSMTLSFNSNAQSEFRHLSGFTGSEVDAKVGWGSYKRDINLDGKPIGLIIDGVTTEFKKGVVAHANSTVVYDLGENNPYDTFSGYIGLEVTKPVGDIKGKIFVSDDKETYVELKDLGRMKATENAQFVELSLAKKDGGNYRYLKFEFDKNGSESADHATIANGKVFKKGYQPKESQNIIAQLSEYENAIDLETLTAALDDGSMTEGQEKKLLQYTLVQRAGMDSINDFLIDNENPTRAEAFMNWFFNDVEALRMYLTAGAPEGKNYARSFEVYAQLWETYKNDRNDETPLRVVKDETRGDLYKRLMTSISLTHSIDVTNWMDGKVCSDPVERYKVYKSLYIGERQYEGDVEHPEGLLRNDVFERLEVEEMREVVNAKMYDYEIAWVNEFCRDNPRSTSDKDNSFPMLYSPHHHIAYKWYDWGNAMYRDPNYLDPETGKKWNEIYDFEKYPGFVYEMGTTYLWHLFEEGSVCGGISKTGSNLAEAFGVPAEPCSQPGHCAFLIYNLDADGNGTWSIDNNVSGWQRSGQHGGERLLMDWGDSSSTWSSSVGWKAVYTVMAQAALNDFDNLQKAEEVMALANLSNISAEQKEALYRQAIKYTPFHLNAWLGLADLAIAENNSNEALGNLGVEMVEALKAYPYAMNPLTDLIINELQTRSLTDAAAQAQVQKITIARTKALQDTSKNTNKDVVSQVAKVLSNDYLGRLDKPIATFAFDGDHAGQLVFSDMFTNVIFRLSVEAGENDRIWTTGDKYIQAELNEAGELVYALSAEELAAINADADLYIQLEGLNGPENYFSIDIQKSANVSGLVADDREHRVAGNITDSMEYSVDGSNVWKKLTAADRFESGTTVSVRNGANGIYTAGDALELSFVEMEKDPDNRTFIPSSSLEVVAYSTQQNNNEAAVKAFDGNKNTYWHTNWTANSDLQRFVTVKLPEEKYVSGLDYIPRLDSGVNGYFIDAKVEVSLDGENFETVATATNWPQNKTTKTLTFEPVKAAYVRITCTNGRGSFASAAEIMLFEDLTADVAYQAKLAEEAAKQAEEEARLAAEEADKLADEEFTKIVNAAYAAVVTRNTDEYFEAFIENDGFSAMISDEPSKEIANAIEDEIKDVTGQYFVYVCGDAETDVDALESGCLYVSYVAANDSEYQYDFGKVTKNGEAFEISITIPEVESEVEETEEEVVEEVTEEEVVEEETTEEEVVEEETSAPEDAIEEVFQEEEVVEEVVADEGDEVAEEADSEDEEAEIQEFKANFEKAASDEERVNLIVEMVRSSVEDVENLGELSYGFAMLENNRYTKGETAADKALMAAIQRKLTEVTDSYSITITGGATVDEVMDNITITYDTDSSSFLYFMGGLF